MALSTGIIPEYVNKLVNSTQRVATSYILTEKELPGNIFTIRSEIRKQLQLISPDIVHIHAAWNAKAAFVEHEARAMGYFTIVSPHGQLSPKDMELNFWKEKLPRIIAYQLRMIQQCHALVVTSEQEQKDMQQLRWKRNLALVPHPLTSGLSDEEICELIMGIYHKVIDTNYRSRVTAEEEVLVNALLKASVWPDEATMPIKASDLETNGVSYRRIYLLTHDQGVLQEFVDGAHKVGIAIPPRPDIDAIPRFKLKRKINKRELRQIRTLIIILHKLTDDSSVFTTEEVNLRTLLHVYCKLRFEDYNEDDFARIVKRHGIHFFTRRLLTRLNELFQLEKGFMPIIPK